MMRFFAQPRERIHQEDTDPISEVTYGMGARLRSYENKAGGRLYGGGDPWQVRSVNLRVEEAHVKGLSKEGWSTLT